MGMRADTTPARTPVHASPGLVIYPQATLLEAVPNICQVCGYPGTSEVVDMAGGRPFIAPVCDLHGGAR